MNELKPIPPLEELGFSDPEHEWVAEAAAIRLHEKLGWAAVAAYSLAQDFSADAESFDAYHLLVADYIEDEPRIVPQALVSARESLSEIEGSMRETAQHTLTFLEAKLSRVENTEADTTTGAGSNPVVEDLDDSEPPHETNEQCLGLEEAAHIVERLRASGRFLPAWGSDAMTGFISSLSVEETLSLDGIEHISPARYFVRFLESLPPLLPVEEAAKAAPARDNSLESLGRKIAQTLKQDSK